MQVDTHNIQYLYFFQNFREESKSVQNASMLRAITLSLFNSSSYIVMFATFTTYFFHGDSAITLAMLFQVMSLFFIVRIDALLLFPVASQLLTESWIGCKRTKVFT